MIPFPAQGHVIPLMEISQCLAKLGFHVTFVNTEFDHRRVLNALTGTTDGHLLGGRIRLVSIPDGLEPGEDRNDLDRLCEGIMRVMPEKLEQLVGELNEREEYDKVTCVIADLNMSWALEVAKKMGIRRAAFWPASAALLATHLSVPKMIEDGVIDENGNTRNTFFPHTTTVLVVMKTFRIEFSCRNTVEARNDTVGAEHATDEPSAPLLDLHR